MPFMRRQASRNTDLQDAKTAHRGTTVDDDAFDDLARAIASGTTRRDSLKLLLVGITSAGLGAGLMENSSQGHAESAGHGPGQVETLAIIKGVCDLPVTIDPSCQAITSFSQLSSCEGVLKQGFIGDYNGCGGGSEFNHSNGHFAGGVNVTPCCNVHDCCYSTCGKSKDECDIELLACMQTLCRQGHPSIFRFFEERICLAEATAFYDIVRAPFIGGPRYRDAQVAACVCCCPEDQTRCNGVCVDTRTDPNNCKGCGIVCQPGEQCTPAGCVSPSASDLTLSPGTLTSSSAGANFYSYGFNGATQTFTVINNGTDSSPTLGLSLSLSPGLPPGLIVLGNDTCSGTSLAVGASCTFDVSFPPPAHVCPGGSGIVFVEGPSGLSELLIELLMSPIC